MRRETSIGEAGLPQVKRLRHALKECVNASFLEHVGSAVFFRGGGGRHFGRSGRYVD